MSIRYTMLILLLFLGISPPDLAAADQPTSGAVGGGEVERLMLQGEAARKAGDLEAAVGFLTAAVARAPERADVLLARGIIYGEAERYPLAIDDLTGAIRLAPQDAAAFGLLAWYLILQGNFGEAGAPAKRAAELDPDNYAWLSIAGHASMLAGDDEGAARCYGRAAELLPGEGELAKGPLAHFQLFKERGWQKERVERYRKWVTARFREREEKEPELAKAEALDVDLLRLYEGGRYREALEKAKESLALRERVLGADHPATAVSLDNLASVYDSAGRYLEAEPLYRRALAIEEKSSDRDGARLAERLNRLAELYRKTGRYAEAEPLYTRAVAIDDKVLGARHPATARDLNNLAVLYESTGRYPEAEPLHLRALAIDEAVYGAEHPKVAIRLNNLAEFYRSTGRFAEAQPLYERALAIDEKALGPSHPETARDLNNLAELYRGTGRLAEAEPLVRRALGIAEESRGEHPETVTYLNNLALLNCILGRFAQAEPLYRRALSLSEKLLGADHPDTAREINNLAALYDAVGRYAEAELLYRRALAIDEKALGPDHPDTACDLANLALLYDSTGRHREAEPLYQRALKIAVRAGSPELLHVTELNYSRHLEQEGNPGAAIFFGKEAINIVQGLRRNVARLGRETLRSFTASVSGEYRRLAQLLIGEARLAEAQQVLGMLKEEEYFQYISRSSTTPSGVKTTASFAHPEEPWHLRFEKLSTDAARLGRELGELRRKDERGGLSEAEGKRLARLLDEEEILSRGFEDFVHRMVVSLKDDARQMKKSEERDRRLAEVGRRNLPGTTALMQTLGALGEGSVLLSYLVMEDRVHIILTTAESQLARHAEVKEGALNGKIFAWRELLRKPASDTRQLGKELYDLLIGPVAGDLAEAGARTLMLSLDGALRYLPFAALFDGGGFLVEKYRTVLYAELAKDKVALPPRSAWKVAALGVSEKVHPDFPPLPFVPAELAAIVKGDAGGVIPGEVHLNRDFTESSLRQSAARNAVIHIASHFRFSPGTDKDSFLLLGDGSSLTVEKVRGGSYFRYAELLTLSACDTALGSSGKGSEIEGFAAVAMERGAKAVIATLWPVADGATAQLMADFYRLRGEEKLPKAEALRQAQLRLLTLERPAYGHPYYWAPFILMGNWK